MQSGHINPLHSSISRAKLCSVEKGIWKANHPALVEDVSDAFALFYSDLHPLLVAMRYVHPPLRSR